MFKIASEWKLIVNEFRANEKASIPAIEPKINFTSNIIGIFATSSTSPSHWYSAGDLLQLYQVGFGVSGYAQTAFLKIILNCYQVHRFNKTICSASNGRSKYNSKPFWINPTTGEIFPAGSTLSVTQKKKLQFWDSILEFKVYGELCKKYGTENVSRQYKLEILPANFLFPALTWNIDFLVTTPTETIFLEVKGRWILHEKEALSSLQKLLRIFQQMLPEKFQELKIISDKRWKVGTTNIYTIPLTEIKEMNDEHFVNVQSK